MAIQYSITHPLKKKKSPTHATIWINLKKAYERNKPDTNRYILFDFIYKNF